ncbi:MAG: histidine--tRNA ligase [Aggregatilineales bacterium]
MPSSARPPGVYDRLPAEAAAIAALEADLARVIASFGYQSIETPMIEYADLFLTKSGDEAINRLFSFELYGRQLCLRPEFTASAARLYVERFQHEPKPIRWQVGGPVFRYESPQHSHSRQFTMLGIELIGPSGVAGDAETLGLAARGLYALGLNDWTLSVGHVGLAALALDRFDLDRRTRRFLLGQIEALRRADRGRAYVADQYEQMCAISPVTPESPEVAEVISTTHADMTRALEMLIESANLGTAGSGRTHADIARRLLTRQQRAGQRGQVNAALDFLERLVAISDTPEVALPALDALLPDDPDIRATAKSFRAALELLTAYDVPSSQVRVEMGLARGLNYYTGIVFEIHADSHDASSQLCGGGRYDDLIRVLGAAHDTPAIGFVYGLERILTETGRVGRAVPEPAARALVVPIDEADNLQAAQLATRLRGEWPVELFTPPTRALSQALAHADKRGIPYVFLIGQAERAANTVTIRDMRTGKQSTLPLSDLPGVLSIL